MTRSHALLLILIPSLTGCFSVTHTEGNIDRHSVVPADLEKDIREYFKLKPELSTPAKIAVVEFGTDEFARIVRDDHPSLEGKDPLQSDEQISTVMPLTGSSLLGGAIREADIRLVSSRAQADVLVLVDCIYRDSHQASLWKFFDLTLIGIFTIPSEKVGTEMIGRATLIDVRNGLVYGISRVTLKSPMRWTPTAYGQDRLNEAREALLPKLYSELGTRIRQEIARANRAK